MGFNARPSKPRSGPFSAALEHGGDMKRLLKLVCPLVCFAVASCSGAPPEPGKLEIQDVEVAALFTVPAAGVSCIRITASNPRRTSNTDFGVAPGASSTSLTMHGVPTGNVIFSGAAFADPCALIVETSSPTWISDDVAAAVSPAGPPPSVTLHFHGVGAV